MLSTHHRPDSGFASPYSYLQLWRNPFGELLPAERGELAILDLAPLLAFLTTPRRAVQVVGDCGFGKTTHLLALARHLPASQLVYYPAAGPRPPLPAARPLLVDEAQRMGWRRRTEMLRRPGPLVLGTHCDFSRRLQRAGFEVLSIDAEQPKSPAEVAHILNRRIESSRLEPRPTADTQDGNRAALPVIDEALAAQLVERFGSNLRAIENCLYDDVQRCVQEKRPWPPAT